MQQALQILKDFAQKSYFFFQMGDPECWELTVLTYKLELDKLELDKVK